jgi:DNA mismatch endonuclease (patch repair protein)
MDTLTTEQRSKNMSKIRSKDSKPEITVRKMLFKEGFRFRLHDKKLPGKPDIVLKKYKTVIFVHGCFWHQHEGCKRANMPKSNLEYWVPKIERNVQRDEEHTEKLKNAGWNVIVIWECEVKNIEKLKDIFNSIKQIQPLNPTYRNSWHQET